MLTPIITAPCRPPLEDLVDPSDEDNARAAVQATAFAIAINTVEPTG
jgi:hypothetical protein